MAIDKERFSGWRLNLDGTPHTFTLFGGDVVPTDEYVAFAIKYIRTEEELEAVEKGQMAPHTIQLALSPDRARALAEGLAECAAKVEEGAGSRETH